MEVRYYNHQHTFVPDAAYYPAEEGLLIAGFNDARTWWPGQYVRNEFSGSGVANTVKQ